MTLVRVRDLNKTFTGSRRLLRRPEPRHVVRDVGFDIEAGETLAIIGESGAGKSTVARLVNRLIEPDSGSVDVLGTDVTALGATELRRFRRHMQMVFQDPHSSLDPRFTIADSVVEPLLVHDGTVGKSERLRRAGELLERVGLDSRYLASRPRQLSGGQLQRVAIARALSVSPELIICDEPVSALDVSVQAQVLNLLLELKRDLGITYIVIIHDLALVPVIADRVIVMRHGEVVEEGTPAAVMQQPQHPYTKDLLASIPSLVPKDLRTVPNPA